MEIKIKNAAIMGLKADLLVLNLFEKTTIPGGATGSVNEDLNGIISKFIIKKENFDGKFGEMYLLPLPNCENYTKLLLVGLGKREDFTINKLRELSSYIIQKAKKTHNVKTVVSMLHGAGCAGFKPYDCAKAIAEGTMIGGYSFDKYKNSKTNNIKEFIIAETDVKKYEEAKQGLEKGLLVGDTISFAKDLINESAEKITPDYLANLASELNLDEVKIYEKFDIINMQMGAFAAVGQGSVNPPKFIHMEYKPSKARKKVVLIGKGITFDAGGLNIKTAASMLTMKDDMSGAAAVLSIMKNIKKFKPDIEVHGLIAACENMPSGSSYKQGDILTAMNGRTIEVDNTDAEGRLTLADALCYAQQLNPDVIIDIATLTGACVTALGSVSSAVLGNNDDLINKVIACANKGGERLWRMPMFPEYAASLKSEIADTKNSGGGKGGTTVAALFLSKFINEDTPWAHIDIAGTAVIDKPVMENPEGATGVGIRTLINYLLSE